MKDDLGLTEHYLKLVKNAKTHCIKGEYEKSKSELLDVFINVDLDFKNKFLTQENCNTIMDEVEIIMTKLGVKTLDYLLSD